MIDGDSDESGTPAGADGGFDHDDRVPPEDTSKEFSDAMEGDRESALGLWRNIANGQVYGEEREWIRHVARAVLDADGAMDRPDALMKAIGLAGKADPWRRMREVATALRDFGAKRKDILDYLQREGLIDPEARDAESLLDRELRREPRPQYPSSAESPETSRGLSD